MSGCEHDWKRDGGGAGWEWTHYSFTCAKCGADKLKWLESELARTMVDVDRANADRDMLRQELGRAGAEMQAATEQLAKAWRERAEARVAALEEAAVIADGCVADECSPRFVANRIREAVRISPPKQQGDSTQTWSSSHDEGF